MIKWEILGFFFLALLAYIYVEQVETLTLEVSGMVRSSVGVMEEHNARLGKIEEAVAYVPKMQEDIGEILDRLDRLEKGK